MKTFTLAALMIFSVLGHSFAQNCGGTGNDSVHSSEIDADNAKKSEEGKSENLRDKKD